MNLDSENKKALPGGELTNLDNNNEVVEMYGEAEVKRSRTRTFRIYEELAASFEKEVSKAGTTQTNLINEILDGYLSWTRYIVNHESPFSTFDSATLRALIESVDDKQLEKVIKGTSVESAIDFIKFRWNKLNFRNIVRYLDLLSSYANIGSINVRSDGIGNGNNNGDGASSARNSGAIRNHGNNNGQSENYLIVIRHHLGKRWSKLMAEYVTGILTTSLQGASTDYEISNKSCFVNLKLVNSKR